MALGDVITVKMRARSIDEEVKSILQGNYERALNIIRENRDKMVVLASKLMEVETLDRPMFEELMNAALDTADSIPGEVAVDA